MQQTSRERVRAILEGTGSGTAAYDALQAPDVLEAIDGLPLTDEWRAYFRQGDVRYVSLAPPDGDRDVFGQFLPGLPADAALSCWGVGRIALQSVEGYHAGHRYWHPLERVDTVDGLAEYPFPDFATAKSAAALREEVAGLHSRGFAAIGQMSQTILETAYLMRGIDRLFLDLYERPDYVHALFARLGEQRVVQARMFAEAGVDVLRIGDDIATQEALMLSLDMYRAFIRPHHAAAIAAARAVVPGLPVLYHSDGNIAALLPDLIEIGVTAINPVQPECMDLIEVGRRFGPRLALWGCTPVQSLYAHGSAEDVRRHTRFLVREVAAQHGVIIQFINIVLTPRVLENLGAFFQEFASAVGRPPDAQ